MKIIRNLLPLLLLVVLVVPAWAAEQASFRAVLIVASNARGPSDSRLAPYEPTLRRILRFESYRFVGQDSVRLGPSATGAMSLGDGHRIELTTEAISPRGTRARVLWMQGRRTLMETVLALRPGVPAVLGGPSTGRGGEVYAVIITAE